MTVRMLFHVTLNSNRQSIADGGIDPVYSTGKRRVIWLCDWTQIGWALAHVAKRKSCLISDLVAYVVFDQDSDLKRTAWKDVFTAAHVVRPVNVLKADELFYYYENGMTPDDIPF